jgi:hypothetical protein
MSANPRQFPVVFENLRRRLLRRFPYALLFIVEDNTLLVIACFPRQPRPVAVAKAGLKFVPQRVLCPTR